MNYINYTNYGIGYVCRIAVCVHIRDGLVHQVRKFL